jgi:hypothetical protein
MSTINMDDPPRYVSLKLVGLVIDKLTLFSSFVAPMVRLPCLRAGQAADDLVLPACVYDLEPFILSL